MDQSKKSNAQTPRIPGQIACADLQTGRTAMGVAPA
jgi:hypothetical protein